MVLRDGWIKTAREDVKRTQIEFGGIANREMYRFKRDSIRECRRMMAIEAGMKKKPKKKGG